MKTKIDLKSAFLGLAFGVLGMLALGAGEGDSLPQIGRYQPATGTDNLLILVDTATGQVWAHRPGGLSVTGSAGGFFDKKPDK